ncbi:MAG TPA: LuxR C-terminal-related transcriptional regulator [Bryobacteraceae bacterium]|nr:LuxR C-terminal-related transcriptional regulator [Bryobacteraceae bacterium]
MPSVAFPGLALAACALFIWQWARGKNRRESAGHKFRLLADLLPIPVLMVDERGVVLFANRAAGDLLGCEELAGSSISAFSADLHHLFHREGGPGADGSVTGLSARGKQGMFSANVRYAAVCEGRSHKTLLVFLETARESHDALPLSPREGDVLYFVAQGLSNKEIAARMEMSESRIKGTLQQLFGRLNVRTRSQLVRIAYERYQNVLEEPRHPAWHPRMVNARRRREDRAGSVILMNRRGN